MMVNILKFVPGESDTYVEKGLNNQAFKIFSCIKFKI